MLHMSSHLVRRGTAVTAGAVVLAGLVAAPVAAFAAETPGAEATFDSAVTQTADPDGAGELYTLTADVRTYATITLPNDATLDGDGHTITAVEDADHRNFPGPVLASAVGDSSPRPGWTSRTWTSGHRVSRAEATAAAC